MTDAATVGLYGKIPRFGDFVTRHLPQSFTGPWHEWLVHWLADGRDALGPAWQDTYRDSPIWRFLLGHGLCGASAWAGVLATSYDSVGRVFPLTLALPVDLRGEPLRLVTGWSDGFLVLETAALALIDERAELTDVQARLAARIAGLPLPPVQDPTSAASTPVAGGTPAWRLPMAPTVGIGPTVGPAVGPGLETQAMAALFAPGGDGWSFWWQVGWERYAPAGVLCRGLPALGTAPALLNGGAGVSG